jgi:gliding motility-associated-like protein
VPCLTEYYDTVTVRVIPEPGCPYPISIQLPNAFSPDGDGVNDYWYPQAWGALSGSISIYNRWGALVFQSNALTPGWDGSYNGTPQPMETYIAIVSATFDNGTIQKKSGNVVLVR